MIRRCLVAALLVLPACAAGRVIAEVFTGGGGVEAGALGGDVVDLGLGALQWGLGGTGMLGLAAAVKAARALRREREAPSRAAGDIEHIRREFAAHTARLSDTIDRVGNLELVLMQRWPAPGDPHGV